MIRHLVGSLKSKEASKLVLDCQTWNLKSKEASELVLDWETGNLKSKDAFLTSKGET